MSGVVDRSRWAELEAATQRELLAYLGTSPLSEHDTGEGISWVITGVEDNTYNGVLRTQLPDDDADRVIGDVLGRFRSRGLPFLWSLNPDDRPHDLGTRLERQGCERMSPGVCMAADLAALNEDARDVPGLVIEPVVSREQLALWCSVYVPDDQRREPLYASLNNEGKGRLRHFLALLDGQPVGTLSVFLGKEAAGLYHFEVSAEARRRGIGTALTLTGLRTARALGYRVAVLGPTAESRNMYGRIGFELFTEVGGYYFDRE